LRRRGWSISAIARHLGHDRKTIRAYLDGVRQPGVRRKSVPDLIDPFVEYCRIRLSDDPHLWASTLLDELQPLGYGGSYQSLTAAIRRLGLRPACVACHAAKGRDVAIIDHPPGAETLCGVPHKVSYDTRGNMWRHRSQGRRSAALARIV